MTCEEQQIIEQNLYRIGYTKLKIYHKFYAQKTGNCKCLDRGSIHTDQIGNGIEDVGEKEFNAPIVEAHQFPEVVEHAVGKRQNAHENDEICNNSDHKLCAKNCTVANALDWTLFFTIDL